MTKLGKLIGHTGTVTSDGVTQTPVKYTILGWEHVRLQNGADTIEIEYETDSRSSTITALLHNGNDVGTGSREALPAGLPGWTEHLQDGPDGLCNLAWAAREAAIKDLVEAAGGEYDEENAGYVYDLDEEGNLVSTDDED